MQAYFTRTPLLLQKIFANYTWRIRSAEKVLYLTFDDGPHPTITPFVLDQLKAYHAKASFFCIGKNVLQFPSVFERIRQEGHTVGNHTHHHLNGWKTKNGNYLQDIAEAAKHIQSNFFRPPYGRITPMQSRHLSKAMQVNKASVIMWDVLSADFDINLTHRECSENVIKNARPGSIIVFHDSEKAWPRLQKTLPEILDYFSQRGYAFKNIG